MQALFLGLDVQDLVIKVEEEQARMDQAVGLNLTSGEVFLPKAECVWDSYTVKKQILYLSTIFCSFSSFVIFDDKFN